MFILGYYCQLAVYIMENSLSEWILLKCQIVNKMLTKRVLVYAFQFDVNLSTVLDESKILISL